LGWAKDFIKKSYQTMNGKVKLWNVVIVVFYYLWVESFFQKYPTGIFWWWTGEG